MRETLLAVLDSAHFRKSERYPTLLKHIVFHTLKGNFGVLKERTIGAEIFGRPADYDTGSDSIVRNTAGEVRRRLNTYFSEHPESPVRIDLPVGSYTAEFHFRSVAAAKSVTEPALAEAAAPLAAGLPAREPVHAAPNRLHRRVWIGTAAAALLLILGGAGYWRITLNSEHRSFWNPVLHNTEPALVVVGELMQASDQSKWAPASLNAGAAGNAGAADASVPGGTSMANAITAAQVCNTFRMYGRSCSLVSSAHAQLPELQNKTVVLIGLDNDWTHRILAPTTPNSESTVPRSIIVDQSSSNQASSANHLTWKVSPDPQNDTDYALVARFHSDITDGLAVVAAGLTPNGTLGAEQFIATPENIEQVFAQAPKGWKGLNFEAVLEINVLQNAPGHVRVVATQFW